ncbi:MAG: alcohol dehydrogenase catalytic domain-containing protein, partial [Planctomycetia bacterium]|nr:alcohol dehydrogenase catalytic domain-containing protein [Planctomycetia bacterium]
RINRLWVCRSDVNNYVEGRIGEDRVRNPATLGHECAGTIIEVGSAVTNLVSGDRVAVDPAVSCGRCDQCLAGRRNTCRNLRFMGCPNQTPGAAAEYRILPATNCFVIPDAMSMDEAVLVEPLSIGLHAARLAAMKPNARAAILGVGPIGLGVLLCVKALAPATIHATDLIDSRLDVARQCGADSVTSATRDDVVATIGREEPLGLDVVFECSGDPACLDQAQELLAPGGTLVMVGIPPTARVDFDAHLMRRKGLTFKAVRRQNECVGPVIELLASGRLDARGLVTHRFPLESIREAFELVASYRDGVIKAVIEVSPGE